MNDDNVGRWVAERLGQGLDSLPESVLLRLAAARATALEGYSPVPVPLRARLANLGLRMQAWQYAAVLILMFSGAFAFHVAHRSDPIEAELALLTGDLPPAAYLDTEFEQWIESSSRCASPC